MESALNLKNMWKFNDGSYVFDKVTVIRTNTETFKACISHGGGNRGQTWGKVRNF